MVGTIIIKLDIEDSEEAETKINGFLEKIEKTIPEVGPMYWIIDDDAESEIEKIAQEVIDNI